MNTITLEELLTLVRDFTVASIVVNNHGIKSAFYNPALCGVSLGELGFSDDWDSHYAVNIKVDLIDKIQAEKTSTHVYITLK